MRAHRFRFALLVAVACVALPSSAGAAALKVQWMPGAVSPGTPAKYNRVGVIKVGPARAKNVLVLEPGTSAGATYFVPLAKWIVSRAPGWQVWSVERRENLLEDQSVVNAAKAGTASGTELFNYYLGYLANHSITHHYQPINPSTVVFAKQWGLKIAVEDLRIVIGQARKLGGKVVLGGHSLGGGVVTAYATWNFGGRPGARDLAGLVFIDGASFRSETAADARAALDALNASTATPWLTFGGIPAPFAGLFNVTGSLGALIDPNSPSLGQQFPLLPSTLKPPVPVTNLGQYGYALNVGTSPPALAAAQAHLGKGISARTVDGTHHTWNGAGALTPIRRFATMFSGQGIRSSDGTEWYFPQRLTDDMGAIGNGLPNPAQAVLDVHSTMGRRLPKTLLMYAFGAKLGGPLVPAATVALAKQSGIPMRNLVLLNRQSTYAHNDPNGAFPNNVFFSHLIPFLARVTRG